MRRAGLAVYEVSAATTEGLRELKFAMAELVERGPRDRARARAGPRRDPPAPRSRNPASRSSAPTDGAYLISGEKPSRWVRQTDFTNDEAVGYLADRLARLGVEEALAKAGAEPGDTVLIGDLDDAVVFDWDPELSGGRRSRPRPARHRPASGRMSRQGAARADGSRPDTAGARPGRPRADRHPP